jgi:hypothetical protein
MATLVSAAAITYIKDQLKPAIDQLQISWKAYKTNYSEAQAVFAYADRVDKILNEWSKEARGNSTTLISPNLKAF